MVTKRIVPLGEMVLLKAIRADRTQGGVMLPEEAQAKRSLGHMVIAVGEDVSLVEVGDVAIIHGNGAFVTMDGVEDDMFLIKEEQILGRLEDIEGE
jgi:co-chaperonin GroES (HSP10)